MNTKGLIYFMIPSIIWGSTWYAIKFQIGSTDPLFSVGFRFLLAGIILFIFCILAKKQLNFPLKSHFLILLQGFCLFGINYWLVYMAERHLTSALVAVIFSTLIFSNIFFNKLILKAPVQRKVIFASMFGLLGVLMLFVREIRFDFSDKNFIALLMCVLAVTIASFGSVLSVYNLRRNIPIVQNNAFGMLYGGMAMILTGLIMDKPIVFETNSSYLISLLYLAVFGSVIGFNYYLKVQSEIGPDKAGYVLTVVPVVALITSTIFESYTWNYHAVVGVILILVGNSLVLMKKKPAPVRVRK